MIPDTQLASLFASLGHPSRVALLRHLLPLGPMGAGFGALGQALDIPPSTLTHHLREMEAAGVIRRRVEGRRTLIFLELGHLAQALSAMTALCCSQMPVPKREKP